MPPTLDDVKESFKKYIKMNNYELVDVVLGCAVANLIHGDAVNLYIVGKSSSGKTEAIRLLELWSKVCFIDDLTTNTLMSGYKQGKIRDSGKLVKESSKGIFLFAIKEFASILSMRSDDLRIILGQIRQIADGKVVKPYGNATDVVWEGKMGFLIGVTPAIDAHHSIISQLGERFIYYRLQQEDEFEVARFAMRIAGKENKLKKEAKKITAEFLSRFSPDMNIKYPEDWEERLVATSMFSVKAKMAVARNVRDGSLQFMPESEAPYRLIKQLKNMATGICLARGNSCMDSSIMEIINKIARDNIPELRQKVIRTMFYNKMYGDHGWTSVQTIANKAMMPVGSVRKVLSDLLIAQDSLVKRMIQGLDDHYYTLSDYAMRLIDKSGIYV